MPSSITPDPSAPLTPEREAEIRARRGHITDAPWGSRGDGEGGNTVQAGAFVTFTEGFASSGDVAHIVADTAEQNYRRATFIARAPHDIDDLLAELDRLRAELETRRAGRVQCNDCGAVGPVGTADDGLSYLFPTGQIGHQAAATQGGAR